MSRTKDQWLERTGGFRLGESPAQFSARTSEIERLTASLTSGRLGIEEIEATQRRICELKGIDFDSDD